MLRIWFDGEDLGRLRVAREPQALWETVLSLQMLRTRQGGPTFARWRERTAARVASTVSPEVLRTLRPLIPTQGYFPDFLTPAYSGPVAEGMAAVARTPRQRFADEVELLAAEQPADMRRDLPTWRADTMHNVTNALASYHRAAIGPYAQRMHALVDADRAIRARALLDGGAEALLESLVPMARWRPPTLEVEYPVEQELRLGGRGLLLVPSVFCWHYPVTLLDPTLPPTLVYPVEHDAGLDSRVASSEDALAALVGSTRGEVLRQLDEAGCSTSELARRLGISLASASQHATVLRRAGLIVSRRAGNSMLHSRTPLGTALLCS